MSNNEIVSKDDWLEARKDLLASEKEFTRLRDELTRKKRQLPWVRIDKEYVFEGPGRRGIAGRPVCRQKATADLPLHVRSGLGRRDQYED